MYYCNECGFIFDTPEHDVGEDIYVCPSCGFDDYYAMNDDKDYDER